LRSVPCGTLPTSLRSPQPVTGRGVDLDPLSDRPPLCRPCLDWIERRQHLAGALGAAVLDRLFTLSWPHRELDSRAIVFSPAGERSLLKLFG